MIEYNCRVCPRCKCIEKRDATIERMTEKIIYFARELKINLQHMNRDVQELSARKIANNAVNGSQGLASAADANDKGYDIAGNEYPMSLHYEKQEKGEDVSCCAIIGVDEKKIYTMKDLTIHMMNEAGNIFMIAEQIHKFMRYRI